MMWDALGRLFWLAWAFIATAGAVEAARDGRPSAGVACYVIGAALAFSLASRA